MIAPVSVEKKNAIQLPAALLAQINPKGTAKCSHLLFFRVGDSSVTKRIAKSGAPKAHIGTAAHAFHCGTRKITRVMSLVESLKNRVYVEPYAYVARRNVVIEREIARQKEKEANGEVVTDYERECLRIARDRATEVARALFKHKMD